MRYGNMGGKIAKSHSKYFLWPLLFMQLKTPIKRTYDFFKLTNWQIDRYLGAGDWDYTYERLPDQDGDCRIIRVTIFILIANNSNYVNDLC